MQLPQRETHRGKAPHGRGPRLNRLLCFAWFAAASACGAGEPDVKAPISREQADEEILRIGKSWESAVEDKGFRTPPSPVTMFSEQQTSTLMLTAGSRTAVETLAFAGSFKVGDSTYECQAQARVTVAVSYGRHADEAAVEVRRPALQLQRACNPPGFPEPILDLPETAARFALRGDRLVPFAPATEKRAYLPTQ